MEDAKLKWDKQLSRQSKTLDEAVETYKSRYGRSPPKGFDAWWKFARLNDVLIVDDYDQIHTSITPFLALDPVFLGSRLAELLTKEPFSSEIQIRHDHPVNISGIRGTFPRPKQMAALFEGFRRFLPEDFGEGEGFLGEVGGDDGLVRLSLSDHDLGGRIMSEDFRRVMMDLASRGEHVELKELQMLENIHRKDASPHGLLQACSWQSLAGRRVASTKDIFTNLDADDEPTDAPISFIKDPLKSFDFCHNPSLIPYHGSYSHDHPRKPNLHPQFVLSKYVQSNQILMTPLEAFMNSTSTIDWEEKTVNQIFWRGSTTGDHFSKRADHYDWRNSHRPRLNFLANAVEGHVDVLVENSDQQVSMQRFPVADLNEHLFDVGLIRVNQCSEDDGTCQEMRDEIQLADAVRPQDTLLYRYALDVDGNGWSSRFRRLLALGQVVFKITIYPEWNTEWLTPWLHYVPVGVDMSDLYHSSAFFIGAPGVSEGNPDLGKVISHAAIDFVDKHWRWVDMQAYMFRLILEYRRAMAHDRDAMSMGGSMLLI
ncbi:hypothetical protein BDY24DRAFT_234134 [Mrakia frigida]|uniref:uncharacterized protein n=1 Tax=Mrakia frigida TaxID=29902 RepID=UPI003FCC164F